MPKPHAKSEKHGLRRETGGLFGRGVASWMGVEMFDRRAQAVRSFGCYELSSLFPQKRLFRQIR